MPCTVVYTDVGITNHKKQNHMKSGPREPKMKDAVDNPTNESEEQVQQEAPEEVPMDDPTPDETQ